MIFTITDLTKHLDYKSVTYQNIINMIILHLKQKLLYNNYDNIELTSSLNSSSMSCGPISLYIFSVYVMLKYVHFVTVVLNSPCCLLPFWVFLLCLNKINNKNVIDIIITPITTASTKIIAVTILK